MNGARPSGPFVTRVNGPTVTAGGMAGAQMYEVVQVGELGLVGEVVRLLGDRATVQVYEDTTMLKPGAPIRRTGRPLSVWLGPGLLGNIYDGVQRPLPGIQARSGAWIRRGEKLPALDLDKRWPFEPLVQPGATLIAGQAIGQVAETQLVKHRILLPPDVSGKVKSIVGPGDYNLRQTLAVIETASGPREITMLQQWPVRVPRPIRERLRIVEPLITGQRIIDTFFPVGKGGAAAIPGGFGTGKTITQHQLAKWSDAEIIVFIGCGERGNEMTEDMLMPISGKPEIGAILPTRLAAAHIVGCAVRSPPYEESLRPRSSYPARARRGGTSSPRRGRTRPRRSRRGSCRPRRGRGT